MCSQLQQTRGRHHDKVAAGCSTLTEPALRGRFWAFPRIGVFPDKPQNTKGDPGLETAFFLTDSQKLRIVSGGSGLNPIIEVFLGVESGLHVVHALEATVIPQKRREKNHGNAC